MVVAAFNEGRGVRPGNTPARRQQVSPLELTFNEGRGVRPGNTIAALQSEGIANERSMRAGGLDPATLGGR